MDRGLNKTVYECMYSNTVNAKGNNKFKYYNKNGIHTI